MTTIAELGLRLTVDGNAAAGLDAATAAVNKYATAAEKAAAVTDQTSEKITRSTKSAQSFANANDGVTLAQNKATRATEAYTAAQTAFATATARGDSAAAAAAATLSNLQTKAAAAQVTLVQVNDAAARGASAADLLALAHGKAAASLASLAEQAGRAASIQNQFKTDAIQTYTSSLEGLRAKYDPIYAASKKYENALKELDQDQRVLALNTVQFSAAQELLRKRFEESITPAGKLAKSHDDVAVSTGNAAFAQRQLGVQTVQLFSSIQAGQPILTAFIQQGHQIVDVALATGTGFGVLGQAVKTAFSYILSPVGLLIGAAAGITALGVAAELATRQLTSVSNALIATRDDYAALSPMVIKVGRDIAATTEASVANATAAAQAFSSVATFSGSQEALHRLVLESVQLQRVMQGTLPEAFAVLVGAMKDPTASAQKLADELKFGVNQTFADYIKRLQETKGPAEAFAALEATIAANSSKARESLSPLGEAVDRLRKSLTGAGDDGKSFGQLIGEAVLAPLKDTVNEIAHVIEKIKEIRDFAANFASNLSIGKTPLTPTGGVIGPDTPQGLFQIKQSTASPLGYRNVADPAQNMLAGLSYIQQQANQPGATEASIAGSYNLGPTGYQNNPGAAQGYIAKVASANISALPSDVASQIEYWGQVLGLDPKLINLGQRMAYVESTGRQYSSSGVPLTPGATPGPTPGLAPFILPGPGDLSGSGPAAIGGSGASQKAIGDATNLAKAQEVQARQVQKLIEAQDQLKHSMQDLDKEGLHFSDQYKILEQSVAVYDVAIRKARDPTLEQTQALLDGAKVTATYGEAAKQLAQVQIDVAKQARDHPDAPFTNEQINARVQAVLAQQIAGYAELNKGLDVTIGQQNRVAAAWAGGAEGAARADAANQAFNATLKIVADQTSPQFAAVMDELTKKYDDVAAGANKVKAAQEKFGLDHQIEMVQAETATLGMNGDQRVILLNHLQKEFELRQRYPQEAMKPMRDALLAENDQLEANTLAFQHQKETLDFLANQFTSAFSTIADAITQAFIQGQGQAVNWGNVMKAVASQVIKAFLQLSIINPIINSLFGQTTPTLSSAFGALGGIGGGGVAANDNRSGGGIIGAGQNLLSVGGAANQLGLFDSLGLGDLFGGIKSGLNSIYSGVQSVLATPVFAGPLSSSAVEGGLGVTGLGTDAAAVAAAGAPSVTLGALLGAGGAGFGAGTLAGGLTAKALGKAPGPNPAIGAGIGTAAGIAGVLLAPETFGVSLLVGGLIGGLLGGVGGGLIGPKPQSSYSRTAVDLDQYGRPTLGDTHAQRDDTAKAFRENQDAFLNALNQILIATDTKIDTLGGLVEVGRDQGGYTAPRQQASLQDAFSQFRFSSKDADLNAAIQQRTFDTLENFGNTIASFKAFLDTVRPTAGADTGRLLGAASAGYAAADLPARLSNVANYVSNIIPALLNQGRATGSLNDAIDQLHIAFDPAISIAHQLAYKENELTAARDKGVASAIAAAQASQDQLTESLQLRGATARGETGAVQYYTLAAFDANAAAQRVAVGNQMAATFGESIRATQGYADVLALLEKTLGAERVVVAKQAAEQLVQVAQKSAEELYQIDVQKMQATQGLVERVYNARAALSGNPADAQKAELYAQEVNAIASRNQLRTQMMGLYGDAYLTTADYASKVAAQEEALGLERLVIQKKYNDQITQTATATITSLADYARGLQTGAASPLSPLAQYDLAQSQFNAVSGAAAAGDYTSIQKLSSYSDALLNASRAVFGSGQGYAADFDRVIEALNKVVQIPTDQLTASIYIAEQRTAAQLQVDAMAQATSVLQSILQELRQQSGQPARAA